MCVYIHIRIYIHITVCGIVMRLQEKSELPPSLPPFPLSLPFSLPIFYGVRGMSRGAGAG